MGQIPFKKLTANVPGKDTRQVNPHKNEPKKANSQAIPYKQAVMGRSNLPSKKGVAGRDVHLA